MAQFFHWAADKLHEFFQRGFMFNFWLHLKKKKKSLLCFVELFCCFVLFFFTPLLFVTFLSCCSSLRLTSQIRRWKLSVAELQKSTVLMWFWLGPWDLLFFQQIGSTKQFNLSFTSSPRGCVHVLCISVCVSGRVNAALWWKDRTVSQVGCVPSSSLTIPYDHVLPRYTSILTAQT